MLLEPRAMVHYVEDIEASSLFYHTIFGIQPIADSPTFHTFQLSNGMMIGLKAKEAVEPPAKGSGGQTELAIIQNSHREVDTLFERWEALKYNGITRPEKLSYGYTFVIPDPDGNRVRVVCLNPSE